MSADEWAAICLTLGDAWPGYFTPEEEVAYGAILAHYDRVAVEAAIKRCARSGGKFRPSAGEIAQAVEEPNQPPAFEQAWPVIADALSRLSPNAERVLERVRERAGDFAAGWVATLGVKELGREPTGEGEFAGAVLHRLRESYRTLASTETGRERTVGALASGGLRLDRGLKRPDYLAVLGVEQPQITTGGAS